jgi:hypothetical protein
MKLIGGPFDDESTADTRAVGEVVNVPLRGQVDGRWYSISHFYEVALRDDELVAVYQASQYEHKGPGRNG